MKHSLQPRTNASSLASQGGALLSWMVANERAILGGLLLLAMLLRVLALFSLRDTIYYRHLLWDEQVYHDWAVRILNGTDTETGVYEYSPLMAYLTAAVYKLFSPDVLFVRLFNIAMGVIICAEVHLLTRAVFDVPRALTATLVAALLGPLVLYSVVPLKTSLGALLFMGATLFMLKSIYSGRWFWLLLTGLSMGLLLNVRPNALAVLPVFVLLPPVARFLKTRKVVPVFVMLLFGVIGVSAATLPFVIRNYQVAGDATLMTSQAGFNFYIANDLNVETPYYHPVTFATTVPSEQGPQFAIEASRRAGKRLTPAESSRFWFAVTLNRLGESPGAALSKLGAKMLAVIGWKVPGHHYSIDMLGRYAPVFTVLLPGFGLLFPLFALGVILFRPFAIGGGAVLAVVVVYAASMVLFFVTARYRLLLLPMMIPFSVHGLFELMTALRAHQYRQLGIAAIVGSICIVFSLFPLRGKGELAAHYNARAVLCMQDDKPDEALQLWQQATLERGTFADFAIQSLAYHAFERGDVNAAKKWMAQLAVDTYVSSEKWQLWGDIHMAAGDTERAVQAYQKSIDANWGRLMPRVKLIQLLQRLAQGGRTTQIDQQIEQLSYVHSFYPKPPVGRK